MENISIETTQNVLINYKPAGIGDRLLAYLLDFAIRFIFFIGALTIGITTMPNAQTGAMVYTIIILIIIFCYDLYMEFFFQGQSIGKMIMKIRVMKLDGSEPTIGSYFIRWLFGIVDVSITSGAAAIISIIVTKNSQRIGDIAANTTVVRLRDKNNLNQTFLNSFDDSYKTVYPEVIKLSDEDIYIVKDLLNVYARLEPTTQAIEAANIARRKLQQKMGVESQMNNIQFFRTVLKDYENELGK